MQPTLIIGYGNFDRQDDGVAWHVLAEVARRLGCAVPLSPEEEFPPNGGKPDFIFELQLTPELAEAIAQYERVCFVDAHTGAVPHDVTLWDGRVVRFDFPEGATTVLLDSRTGEVLVPPRP
jgi:Ni,Fe-hydrogenase maturation factor